MVPWFLSIRYAQARICGATFARWPRYRGPSTLLTRGESGSLNPTAAARDIFPDPFIPRLRNRKRLAAHSFFISFPIAFRYILKVEPMRNRRAHIKRRPKRIRLTDRDRRILETIYAYDGIVSLKQIDRLFFSGQGRTWPRERMRALLRNGYVAIPDKASRHRVPYGATIFFLDVRGAEVVAALYGVFPRNIKWRKKPRWSLISHDLAVNDFRIDVQFATQVSADLALHSWIPESKFWSESDRIKYRTAGGAVRYRRVRPDGFFTLRRPIVSSAGTFEEMAFLLEIDMGTEDHPRFAREKVRPGVAYLKSRAYLKRFGVNYGRWLVVTTSDKRLANMKTQTEKAGGSNLFYFTTFEKVSQESILKKPIWHIAGSVKPTSIL